MGKIKKIVANKWFWMILSVLLLAATFFLYEEREQIKELFDFSKTPYLQVETPNKLSANQTESFTLDVTLSSLGEGDVLFPAASLSLAFDNTYLEFVGVKEGNVLLPASLDNEAKMTLPTWQVNVERSNQTGQIQIMYLDMTGGRQAFSYSGFVPEEQNVLLRLEFRLRGSALPGGIYDITITDAVIAASEEQESLSYIAGSLKTKDSRIVIDS